MVCVVKVAGVGGLVPACGTLVRDGMQVESDSEQVFEATESGAGASAERSRRRLRGTVPDGLSGPDGHPADDPPDRGGAVAGRHRDGQAGHRFAGGARTNLSGPLREGVPAKAA